MLKATSPLRSDQVVQGFVDSGLQNLQDLQPTWATCSNVQMGKVFFPVWTHNGSLWIDEITIFCSPELTGQEPAQEESVHWQLNSHITELTYDFKIDTR